MHLIERCTGRLVEVRIEWPVAFEEVVQVRDGIAAAAAEVAGRFVLAADLHRVQVLASEVIEGFIRLMVADNPKVERCAYLIGSSAIFGLQIERAIRESDNPARRAFHHPEEVEDWLGEILDDEERLRLKAFLLSTL